MDKYDSNIELNPTPDEKALAEKELMEELRRGEQSSKEHGYIDISESKARLGCDPFFFAYCDANFECCEKLLGVTKTSDMYP